VTTLVPNGSVWLPQRNRLLTGLESLCVQGFGQADLLAASAAGFKDRALAQMCDGSWYMPRSHCAALSLECCVSFFVAIVFLSGSAFSGPCGQFLHWCSVCYLFHGRTLQLYRGLWCRSCGLLCLHVGFHKLSCMTAVVKNNRLVEFRSKWVSTCAYPFVCGAAVEDMGDCL
jgi:hypothetical protein